MWTVERDALLAGLERVEAATAEKSPHPYLGLVLCSFADQAHLRLATTNLLLAIETTVAATVEKKFPALAISHQRLRAVVSTMPAGPLRCQLDKNNRLQVKCAGSRQYALPTVAGTDFSQPQVPRPDAISIELPPDLLVSALDRVRYAIPAVHDRPQLDGVGIEILEGRLSAVAMCGAMLGIWEAKTDAPNASFFLPLPVFKPLRLVAHGGDEPLNLQIDPQALFVRRHGTQITASLPTTAFPPWRQLLASLECRAIARIPAIPMQDALRAVSTAAPGEAVRLLITAEGLEVSVVKDECEAHDVVPIEVEAGADELDVLVNPVYLIDTIKGADSNFVFQRATDQLGVVTEDFRGFLARVVR